MFPRSVAACTHVLDDVELGKFAVKKIPVGDDKAWLKKTLREVALSRHTALDVWDGIVHCINLLTCTGS